MMNDHNNSKEAWLYGGIALGVVAGAVAATYFWTRRNGEFGAFQGSPVERAEQLIESCESKLDSIENAINDLKASR